LCPESKRNSLHFKGHLRASRLVLQRNRDRRPLDTSAARPSPCPAIRPAPRADIAAAAWTSAPSATAACQPQCVLVEECTGERDHVGLALGDDGLGLLGSDDQPNRACGDAGLSAYPLGERHVVTGWRGLRASAATPPEETHTKSRPAALSALATATASSGVNPPSIQSLPVMRAPRGTPLGTIARTALTTANGKRMRFSSVRRTRHSACWRRPTGSCAGDIRGRGGARSYRIRGAPRAALRQRMLRSPRAMSSSVMARGIAQSGPKGMAEGAIVSQGSAPALSDWPPSQGRWAEPLRPEWAS